MIYQYLQANQEYIKELSNHLTVQRLTLLKEFPLFEEEIDKQYFDSVVSIIVTEVTGRLGVSTEDVLVVMEDLDLRRYLE